MSCFFTVRKANAQSYSIESFSGVKTQIKLVYKPFSGILTISCPYDTLMIYDYMVTHDVKVLNNRFLQIPYVARAGSNEGLGYFLLLSIDSGKLHPAMLAKSFAEYDMRNIYHIKGNRNEYSLFKLEINLTGKNNNDYRLIINDHSESSSERDPKSNHRYDRKYVLNFDPVQKVFYTTHSSLSGTFAVISPGPGKTRELYINGKLPVVAIDEDTYYYYKEEWYKKNTEDQLEKMLAHKGN